MWKEMMNGNTNAWESFWRWAAIGLLSVLWGALAVWAHETAVQVDRVKERQSMQEAAIATSTAAVQSINRTLVTLREDAIEARRENLDNLKEIKNTLREIQQANRR
jgi:hypothetical protein